MLLEFGEADRHVAFMDGENGEVRALERPPYANGDEADDLCLAFSSGSAGGLKGLVISRRGAELTLPPVVKAVATTHDDRLLLFLPMSNFQQRMMYYAAIWYDFDIAVTDYTQLYPAMKILEPSILIAPPIFYQLMHTRFAAALAKPGWQPALARFISLLPGLRLRQKLMRRLFREFYGVFGRRMRLVISGMAPLNRNTSRFFDRLQLPLCRILWLGGSRLASPTGRLFPTNTARWERRWTASRLLSPRMARSLSAASNS